MLMEVPFYVSLISIHALLAESDRAWPTPTWATLSFLSTLSLRRATHTPSATWPRLTNFYPRSPCGERRASFGLITPREYFYPRSPCGERPRGHRGWHHPKRFLSTLSLRRATGICTGLWHALQNFYPRSPCGERPGPGVGQCPPHHDFYPRSPCGERPGRHQKQYGVFRISIHALLAESDATLPEVEKTMVLFLSTLSLRRATLRVAVFEHTVVFLSTLSLRRATRDREAYVGNSLFLSTLSLRRATIKSSVAAVLAEISIHALRAESDSCGWCGVLILKVFLSTLSLRRATEYWVGGYGTANNFYPRSPCGERRRPSSKTVRHSRYFYPRSPCGERQQAKALKVAAHGISIHALLAESDPGQEYN